MTLAKDFFIYSLFLSAIWMFLSFESLEGGSLVSPRLAFGEFLKLAAEGLNCLEDCVPGVMPVLALLCPLAKLKALCC